MSQDKQISRRLAISSATAGLFAASPSVGSSQERTRGNLFEAAADTVSSALEGGSDTVSQRLNEATRGTALSIFSESPKLLAQLLPKVRESVQAEILNLSSLNKAKDALDYLEESGQLDRTLIARIWPARLAELLPSTTYGPELFANASETVLAEAAKYLSPPLAAKAFDKVSNVRKLAQVLKSSSALARDLSNALADAGEMAQLSKVLFYLKYDAPKTYEQLMQTDLSARSLGALFKAGLPINDLKMHLEHLQGHGNRIAEAMAALPSASMNTFVHDLGDGTHIKNAIPHLGSTTFDSLVKVAEDKYLGKALGALIKAGEWTVEMLKRFGRETSEAVKSVAADLPEWRDRIGTIIKEAATHNVDEVVLFTYETPAKVTLNLDSGAFYFFADMGFGWHWDNDGFHGPEETEDPNDEFTNLDWLEMSANSSGVTYSIDDSDYFRKRAEYRSGNQYADIYFASKRWSDWAGTKRATNHATWAIITEGESLQETYEEILAMLQLEFYDVVAWVESRVIGDGRRLSFRLFEWLAKGMKDPIVDIRGDQVPLLYAYELQGGEFTPILKYFHSMVTGKEVELPPINEDHMGFGAKILIGDGGGDYLTRRLNEFERRYEEGRFYTNDLAKRILQDASHDAADVLRDICEQAGFSANGLEVVSYEEIDRRLKSEQYFEWRDIVKSEVRDFYTEGDPIVDLTRSKTATKLSERLKKFAIGNEPSARVTRLEFNLATYVVSCEFTLHHEHRWRVGM